MNQTFFEVLSEECGDQAEVKRFQYRRIFNQISRLLLLVMIAFVWRYKVGDFIDRNIRPIIIKK